MAVLAFAEQPHLLAVAAAVARGSGLHVGRRVALRAGHLGSGRQGEPPVRHSDADSIGVGSARRRQPIGRIPRERPPRSTLAAYLSPIGAKRWVAPPSWPAPPSPDWSPPAGWPLDPAWGPPPPGWVFWQSGPPSKRRVWLLVAAAFGAVGIVVAVIASVSAGMSRDHSVRYEVTGSATSASVTVTLPGGSVSRLESRMPF